MRIIDLDLVAKILINNGYTQSDVARIFGVSRQRVNQMLNRHKNNARKLLHKALKSGRVVKPDRCEDCGAIGIELEAHHPDHHKPYDVIWLCLSCHGLRHRTPRQP